MMKPEPESIQIPIEINPGFSESLRSSCPYRYRRQSLVWIGKLSSRWQCMTLAE